ncbi:MAG: hypothetical protein LBL18_00140 [Bacteroidales bacterium]|jgi:hypothetical protein|nr:hypothetical protein [Bacteroidales bacterium]
MNWKYLSILFLTLVLGLTACRDTPKQSCRKFLYAYLAGDFYKAQQYATTETKEMLVLLNQYFKQAMDTIEVNRIENANLRIRSLQNEYVTDSSAVLFCKFYIDNKLDSTRVLMVKEGERWLAKFPYIDR